MSSPSAAVGPQSLTLGVRRGWQARPLEAVVLDGSSVVHFRRLTDRPDRPWQRLAVISTHACAAGAIAVIGGGLYARVTEDAGVCAYRFDDQDAAWQRLAPGELVEQWPPPEPVLVRGWPQQLVDEDGSIFGYHRPPGRAWQRNSCLRVAAASFAVAANSSVKLAQVTGDRDATPTPWGERAATLSRSVSTAGVRGTDLGVRFDHAGRSFLLFGDTVWKRPWLWARDAIAEVISTDGLPQVRFHGSPLKLRGMGATMREYDVPLDAFSYAGALFGLFSSNHGRHRQVMGRSVLSRLQDPELTVDPRVPRRPIAFEALATLSDQFFINVSAQRRPAAEVPGCGDAGDVLLLWGTGSYRASEVRLARLDADALDRLAALTGPAATEDLGLRYWDGAGWSGEEAAAAALFTPGAYGELSVRWVPQVGRYVMLLAAGPGDAAGPAVTLRWADQPWGPWTTPLRLLDWVAVGMSADPFTRFIKSGAGDPVAESLFPAQARGTGGAYAPYLFDSRRDGADVVLRYTLSTWNPYQVVLMEHRLVPGEF